MEEITIGEYIRTVFGEIYKYDEGNQYCVDKDNFYNLIVKHSKDIKDLIEPRDFVNEMIVDKDCNGLICTDINGDFHYLDKIQIKTILTHEMYNQNCYKVGDIK